MNGQPFYKYYNGVPFWSGEYLWFVMTRQLPMLWQIALFLYVGCIPWLPPPIWMYILMIIFAADPKLFDQYDPKNGFPELGAFLSQAGYVLKFSWKTVFFDWQAIKPYDGIVDISDLFAL